MLPESKGIYPIWVSKSDIINQVLREIIREGGRLPYTYVINPNHDPAIKERMKAVLDQMIKEKLIQRPLADGEFIEIDLEGSRAVRNGYRKYKRAKKWDTLVTKLTRVSLFFFFLLIIGLFLGLIFLILHLFKIV